MAQTVASFGISILIMKIDVTVTKSVHVAFTHFSVASWRQFKQQ
jgi:hypothetical protein